MSKPKRVLEDHEVEELMSDLDDPTAGERQVEQLYQRYCRGEKLDPIQEMLLKVAGRIPDDPTQQSLNKKEGA